MGLLDNMLNMAKDFSGNIQNYYDEAESMSFERLIKHLSHGLHGSIAKKTGYMKALREKVEAATTDELEDLLPELEITRNPAYGAVKKELNERGINVNSPY